MSKHYKAGGCFKLLDELNIESNPRDPEVKAACEDLILTCSVEITNRNTDWMRFAGILKVTKEFCWF